MLESWKKGDQITVTRRKLGGGTEKVLAQFQSTISNGRQIWCLIKGKRVRVSLSGVSSPEDAFKEPTKTKPDAVAKSVAKEADKLIEKIQAKTGAPVKTEVVEKPKEEVKAPTKKVISTKDAPKQPNKTERVVVAIAKGEISTDKIHVNIGCDTSLVSDWSAVIKALETDGAKFDDDAIMKRVGRPAHLVAKYYNIYLNAKAKK